ncbi:MAG: hypothetical protein ACKOU7_09915 [Ferruginibacter sp.]
MRTRLLNKKILFLLAATSILLSTISCKKIQDLLTFTINVENNFTVGASGPINIPVEILTPQVTTNSNQQFQNNNSNVNKVKDIKLEKVDLQIVSPAGKTFSFLQSVHIYISTDGNDEIELAYLDNISSTATAISLIPTSASLDKYVKASSYNLRTKIVTKQALTQNVEIKNLCRFKVTANL